LALIGPAALNPPNPALVTHRAAQRLPRPALLIFCAAYVLPGLFGRDPWKNADITAFGYMLGIAEGRTPWYDPTLGGLPADSALLPYWIGAAFIRALGPWLGPALAARVPFALLLVGALVGAWYATYYLARTESAQPLAFAFGGEAGPTDYARAIADGALLALIASLGLLQLGHETTPELAQLAAVTLFLYGFAALPFRTVQARIALVLALPALAASGAPSIATVLGIVGAVLCRLSPHADTRRATLWVCASAVASAVVAAALGAWGWRIARFGAPGQVIGLVRLLVWFTWPAWPLALWTLWRWRERLSSRHIMFPLLCAGTALAACIAMGGSDRALMLGLPPLAVLAAFALRRSTGSRSSSSRSPRSRSGSSTRRSRPACRPSPRPTSRGSHPATRRRSRSSHSCSRPPRRSPGSGWCTGAPAARATRCGRAWCCPRAASACAGCSS